MRYSNKLEVLIVLLRDEERQNFEPSSGNLFNIFPRKDAMPSEGQLLLKHCNYMRSVLLNN